MTYFFETYGCQTWCKQVRRSMPEAPELRGAPLERSEEQTCGNTSRKMVADR